MQKRARRDGDIVVQTKALAAIRLRMMAGWSDNGKAVLNTAGGDSLAQLNGATTRQARAQRRGPVQVQRLGLVERDQFTQLVLG